MNSQIARTHNTSVNSAGKLIFKQFVNPKPSQTGK
jgi:hypothetical protein